MMMGDFRVKRQLAKELASGREYTVEDLRRRTGLDRSEITSALRGMNKGGLVKLSITPDRIAIWRRRDDA